MLEWTAICFDCARSAVGTPGRSAIEPAARAIVALSELRRTMEAERPANGEFFPEVPFAALNVGTGEVIYDCKRRHTARDVLSFFKLIDLHVPRELDIHVVLDNLSAYKAPEIKTWLAHPKRARWHLHFTPTSSSWLDLVEGWFKLVTERRLRHGVFSSVEALREAIELWAEHWNDDPRPFVWRKTAEEIEP